MEAATPDSASGMDENEAVMDQVVSDRLLEKFLNGSLKIFFSESAENMHSIV